MRRISKFAIILFAASVAIVPLTANANGFGTSISDSMFNWPTGWPKTTPKPNRNYTVTQSLKTFSAKREKAKKNLPIKK